MRQYFLGEYGDLKEVTKEEYVATEHRLGLRYAGIPDDEPCNWNFSYLNGVVSGVIEPNNDFREEDN